MSNQSNQQQENSEEEDVDVLFQKYLEKLYKELSDKNKAVQKSKIKLPAPKLVQQGKIRTIWENYQSMTDKLQRSPEHLRQFFADELGMECSLSQKTAENTYKLVIKGKGRLKKKGILKILYSYIDTYVQCSVCGEMDTELTKEQRQYFVTCKKCLSKTCCQI